MVRFLAHPVGLCVWHVSVVSS